MINVADEKWNISHSSRNSNVCAETLENNCKAKDRNEYPSYTETIQMEGKHLIRFPQAFSSTS